VKLHYPPVLSLLLCTVLENYYLDRLSSDLANGKKTIIKRNKGQSNLAKAASPAHWSFGLQSWNLAPHVGGTGRLNGSEIAQIDSDGGRLSIVYATPLGYTTCRFL